MFYCGLEFHDLAPESILHISSFIVVCEAFLRITSHFGLWLKTFKVEPKMIEGRHTECGGAFISKTAGAPWPEGSFQEESCLWQREWFYITVPRGTKCVAPPAFRSGPPPQLASGVNKGLNWGPSKDVPLLQGRARDLLERDINLAAVTQVMLIHHILPCKRHPLRLWEFNSEGPRALQHFVGATPMEMYKLFFGPQVVCPDSTEDAGLSCNRLDTQVSSLVPGLAIRIFIIKLPLKELSFKQEWIAKAKLTRCPAPLPETTPDPVLVKMLGVAPLEEGEGGNRETTTSTKEAFNKGGIESPSLQGEKRTTSEDPEAKALKRGRKSQEGPVPGRAPAAQSPQRNQPSSKP